MKYQADDKMISNVSLHICISYTDNFDTQKLKI